MHTPGPWNEIDGFVMSATGDFICDPHCDGGPVDHAERDANTNLIAAAPDLLATLEGVYHQLATDSDLQTITGADKYKRLTLAVGRAIAKADPGNPQIRFNHEMHILLELKEDAREMFAQVLQASIDAAYEQGFRDGYHQAAKEKHA